MEAIVTPPSAKKHLLQAQRLRERCDALAAVVQGAQSFYSAATTVQKMLMETTLGASIFYLRGRKCDLWDGFISKDALTRWQETGKKQSEEHTHPRRITGRKLLQLPQTELTGENLEKLYLNEYGKFTYVTSKENGKLRRYQSVDVFICAEHACEKAGVERLNAKEIFKKQLGTEDITLPDLYSRLPKLVKACGSSENL
jgi:hypothetical protein